MSKDNKSPIFHGVLIILITIFLLLLFVGMIVIGFREIPNNFVNILKVIIGFIGIGYIFYMIFVIIKKKIH